MFLFALLLCPLVSAQWALLCGDAGAGSSTLAHVKPCGFPFGARDLTQMVPFHGRLFLLGGERTPRIRESHVAKGLTSEVWASSDVATTLEVQVTSADLLKRTEERAPKFRGSLEWTFMGDAPWGPRGHFPSVAFLDRLWVFGGLVLAQNGTTAERRTFASNDVWASTDGATWTKTVPHCEGQGCQHWSPRMKHRVVVINRRLFLSGGFALDLKRMCGGALCHPLALQPVLDEVWVSEDGISWRPANLSSTDPLPLLTRIDEQVEGAFRGTVKDLECGMMQPMSSVLFKDCPEPTQIGPDLNSDAHDISLGMKKNPLGISAAKTEFLEGLGIFTALGLSSIGNSGALAFQEQFGSLAEICNMKHAAQLLADGCMMQHQVNARNWNDTFLQAVEPAADLNAHVTRMAEDVSTAHLRYLPGHPLYTSQDCEEEEPHLCTRYNYCINASVCSNSPSSCGSNTIAFIGCRLFSLSYAKTSGSFGLFLLDAMPPTTFIAINPSPGSSDTFFALECDEDVCLFMISLHKVEHDADAAKFTIFRNAVSASRVDLSRSLEEHGSGTYVFSAQAFDAASNFDMALDAGRNVFEWEHSRPLSAGKVLAVVLAMAAAISAMALETRRREARREAERFAKRKMRRKFKSLQQRGEDSKAAAETSASVKVSNAAAGIAGIRKRKRLGLRIPTLVSSKQSPVKVSPSEVEGGPIVNLDLNLK